MLAGISEGHVFAIEKLIAPNFIIFRVSDLCRNQLRGSNIQLTEISGLAIAKTIYCLLVQVCHVIFCICTQQNKRSKSYKL